MKAIDISGEYRVVIGDKEYSAVFPGTLDSNKIGEREKTAEKWHPDAALEEVDAEGITTRFTRRYAYEGSAKLIKSISLDGFEGKRAFVDIERARVLSLCVNGKSAPEYVRGTLSTPYCFEVTGLLDKENELCFTSNNTYEGLPKTAIKFSSAATNETQTNWLGFPGKAELRFEESEFIKSINVDSRQDGIDVRLEIDAASDRECEIYIKSDALLGEVRKTVEFKKGINVVVVNGIKAKPGAELWDEYEGKLHALTVGGDGLEEKTVSFGLRSFGDDGSGHLSLNGRRIFLRSEANCCVFAESGHMPMTKDEWTDKLLLYKSYGINAVRFHSHCPPEAAFAAADELGMIVQPELSNWDPKNALESEESFEYYSLELERIIREYGNHPSFCMMAFGNELSCNDTGLERLHKMIDSAKEYDSTRLYAISSNGFYGERGADEKSDFFTASNFYKDMMRGTSSPMAGYINNDEPDTKHNFDELMRKIRKEYKKPVFSFEVGQYEVLLDFTEIEKFKSILIPDNLRYVKERVSERGFLDKWDKWVAASGELALISYREEIEAAMRTEDMSGISLLGLQDFPGQGTALVGMINSHFEPKPYPFAQPERFRRFFRSQLPLALMDRYTYTAGEAIDFDVSFANYGKDTVSGTLECTLEVDDEIIWGQKIENVSCACSKITRLGSFSALTDGIERNTKGTLKISLAGIENEYPVWIYKDNGCSAPEGVSVCKTLNEALSEAEKGRTVFLEPVCREESFKESIKTHFTTDFWSVGTFPEQPGYMGIMPEPEHPLFKDFPTESHADWQWHNLTRARAMVLPNGMKPLFDVMDSYARLRTLAFMTECCYGDGKILISSMGLLDKTKHPEVRTLLGSVFGYMLSEDFCPEITASEDMLRNIIK